MSYKLFLDDHREPKDAAMYMHRRIGKKNLIYLTDDWVIVKNYKEFVRTVQEKGLPFFVSFDHDLADSCYGRPMDHDSMQKFYQEKKREMTGYDCAKWLVNHCITRALSFPEYAVHSYNPVGIDNIEAVIRNFKIVP